MFSINAIHNKSDNQYMQNIHIDEADRTNWPAEEGEEVSEDRLIWCGYVRPRACARITSIFVCLCVYILELHLSLFAGMCMCSNYMHLLCWYVHVHGLDLAFVCRYVYVRANARVCPKIVQHSTHIFAQGLHTHINAYIQVLRLSKNASRNRPSVKSGRDGPARLGWCTSDS